MSHTAEAFKNGKALITFLTAGDPSIEDSVKYVLEMEQAGADLVEIGVPFSDPVADGPVIMAADQRALQNGVCLPKVIEEVKMIRQKSQIPIVLLTYYNPIFVYGPEAFFAQCEAVGIDGVIIPDLPLEEQSEVHPSAQKHGIDVIQLVAPTSESRIRTIAKEASGFIYVVSSMGVTGMRNDIKTDMTDILKVIRQETDVPAAVGFGIHTPEQAAAMAKIADGVITGSAVVDIIGRKGTDASEELQQYVHMMKEAIK